MKNKLAMVISSLLVALLLAPASLLAADAPSEAALQKRFKARYPQIQQLKTDGVIGETSDGLVDFVKGRDAKAADVVKEENADRLTLYKLIADREGISVEVVTQRAAKRNFQRAKPGEWLKQDGKWKQKA